MKTRLFLAICLALIARSALAATPDAPSLLAILDSGYDWERDTVVRSQVTVREGAGEPDVRDYEIMLNSDGRSIVHFLSAAERGMKVLNAGGDMWILAPRTKRAIKIPPIQRLFGDASIGDILSLRWARDYEPVGPSHTVQDGGRTRLRLDLKAHSNAATYRSVSVWFDAATSVPVRAEYSLASGKLHKSGTYPDARNENGRLVFGPLVLTSPAKPGRTTEIKLISSEYRDLPDNMFTRAHLETAR